MGRLELLSEQGQDRGQRRPGLAAHVVDRRCANEAHLGVLARQSSDQEREHRGLEADVPEEIRECVAGDLTFGRKASQRHGDDQFGSLAILEQGFGRAGADLFVLVVQARDQSRWRGVEPTARGDGSQGFRRPGAECGRRIVEQGRQRLLGDRCFPGKTLTQVADDGSRRIPDHLRFVLHGPNEMGKHLRELGPR